MKKLWQRFGGVLLVVALGGGIDGCGNDDGDTNAPGGGASGRGSSGTTGGPSGAGGSQAGGAGGSAGATVECGSAGMLPAACVSCIQAAVTTCGAECVALLNCSANKCAKATTQADQQACVTKCCLTEATTAVSAPGGQDALRAAQTSQRMGCAAMCGP